MQGEITQTNRDLGKSQVTPWLRISSAAIFYDEIWGQRYQYETWVFSEDKERQRSVQVIHGNSSGSELSDRLVAKTQKVHSQILANLVKKCMPK